MAALMVHHLAARPIGSLPLVMGSADHETCRSQAPTLRDLHPQIDRAQSRPRIQLGVSLRVDALPSSGSLIIRNGLTQMRALRLVLRRRLPQGGRTRGARRRPQVDLAGPPLTLIRLARDITGNADQGRATGAQWASNAARISQSSISIFPRVTGAPHWYKSP
jgi:hypothetical protein